MMNCQRFWATRERRCMRLTFQHQDSIIRKEIVSHTPVKDMMMLFVLKVHHFYFIHKEWPLLNGHDEC